MDYASSGVDIEKESEAVRSLVGAITYQGRPAGSLGASVPLPGGFAVSYTHLTLPTTPYV